MARKRQAREPRKRALLPFKRTDVVRVIRSARDADMPIGRVEIVAKDGTTFRIYGDKAALTEKTANTEVEDWIDRHYANKR